MTEYQKKENLYDNATPSRFIPIEKIPSSDCWLKKEEWFWQNEQDWKNYMEKKRKNK